MPGDGTGQAVGLGDVLAPAEQGEGGPDGGDYPRGTAHQPDVGTIQPDCCKERDIPSPGYILKGSVTSGIVIVFG